jgi:hypothetical protein
MDLYLKEERPEKNDFDKEKKNIVLNFTTQ